MLLVFYTNSNNTLIDKWLDFKFFSHNLFFFCPTVPHKAHFWQRITKICVYVYFFPFIHMGEGDEKFMYSSLLLKFFLEIVLSTYMYMYVLHAQSYLNFDNNVGLLYIMHFRCPWNSRRSTGYTIFSGFSGKW